MAEDHAPALAYAGPRAGMDAEMTPRMGAGGLVDLKLGHYGKDGIEVVDAAGEIDIYTATRLRELLIDLVLAARLRDDVRPCFGGGLCGWASGVGHRGGGSQRE